jgi:hypothetical protein
MASEFPRAERSFELNRLSWDERVNGHMASGFYDVEGFRRTLDSLGLIESAEIGNVSAFRIAHLQCHSGLDSLSLARRGGKVTGLDFSGTAIAAARRLADQVGISAAFVQGNVYAAPALLQAGQWDLVFTTWGTVTWLPNDPRRGRHVAPPQRCAQDSPCSHDRSQEAALLRMKVASQATTD